MRPDQVHKIKSKRANAKSGICKGKSIKVLLVEDNQVNQIVASRLLTTLGIAVDIASNGLEAVEMIQCKRYHLVLMDLQMPLMDGFEATQEIRTLDKPYFKTIPIIALTASAISDVADRVLKVGMNDLVSKPFVPWELQAKISAFVGYAA